MKDSKILFVDLDATLLSDDKTISAGNRQAIQRALDAGNYVVAATGRPVESGRIVIKELGLTMPGCYMIAFNGSVLYDCSADRVLCQKTIPVQYVYQLFDKAHRAGIYIQTYNQTEILTEKHSQELDFYITRTKMKYKLQQDVTMSLNEEPYKVLLINLEDRKVLEEFQQANAAWAEGKLTSFFSCDQYLEYCPLGVSKGAAIEYLSRFLNIPIEHTIAVGDEKNDISMIRAAHIGVAVKNAVDEAKAAADYVTENDNNHDAIAEVIEKFILE
ncbi:MAG: HAD family phosphatase [Lachnospiraceae bacterium]|nr:HAD family phosphatase [Lachnospiraceae bacterium]